MYSWKIALDETDQEAAVTLLLTHHDQLGLPYPFYTIVLSLYYSLYQGDLLVCTDNKGQIAGAAAYTRGTEEDRYMDTSKVEVHTVFLLPEHRSGRLFRQGLQEVVRQLQATANVLSITFYVSPNPVLGRLFGKFAKIEKTVDRKCGTLDLYVAHLSELQHYLNRL